MSSRAGTEGARALDSHDSPQRELLRGNVPLQMDKETVGLEMTSVPISYSDGTPSESEPTVEIKRVSGCRAPGIRVWETGTESRQ